MARRSRSLGSVGTHTKKSISEVEGLDELLANLRRMQDNARVQILEGAIDQGSTETLELMEALAPRSEGAGTRGYHGADRLINAKRFSKRDSRSQEVGIGRGADGAWFLKFAELGTIYHPDDPFIRPTAKVMRPRMLAIVIAHWRRAVRLGIR